MPTADRVRDVAGRGGQPTQVQVHITLAQLRNMPGASDAEAAWRAAAAAGHGWLAGPDADAAACDATLVPIVTGHLDADALDRMVRGIPRPDPCAWHPATRHRRARRAGPQRAGWRRAGQVRVHLRWVHLPQPHTSVRRDPRPAPQGPAGDGRRRLVRPRRARLLPAPAQLASGPLDPGQPPLRCRLPLTETIPAHLRRAATTRHPHCAFPGCEQPASALRDPPPASPAPTAARQRCITWCRFAPSTTSSSSTAGAGP